MFDQVTQLQIRALTTVRIAQLVKGNKWKQERRKATGQQMVNRALCSSISYRWLTSSGQTQNSRAKCIIYESHLCSNCSHLWALPLQMLLNSIKSLVTHVEAITAWGSQCGLFTIYKWALLLTSGGALERISSELRANKTLYCPPTSAWKWARDHLPLKRSTSSSYVTAKKQIQYLFPCYYLRDVTD